MIQITVKKGSAIINQLEVTPEEKADYERRARLDVENLNRWVSEGHEVEVVDLDQPPATLEEPPSDVEDQIGTVEGV